MSSALPEKKDNSNRTPEFLDLGMSKETAEKVLRITSLDYPHLQNLFVRCIVSFGIFMVGIAAALYLWDKPMGSDNISTNPLAYFPAFIMSYSMWMAIDVVFRVIDQRKGNRGV